MNSDSALFGQNSPDCLLLGQFRQSGYMINTNLSLIIIITNRDSREEEKDMSDYSEIEKKVGTKVVEVHPKADTEGVYTVLFENNLEEEWTFKDGHWEFIA